MMMHATPALRLLLILLSLAGPLYAQADPFADPDEAAASEPGADDAATVEADNPFAPLAPAPAAGTPAARAAATDSAATTAPPVADSAVVDAIRSSAPQTARELFRAVDQLLRLDRADVAKEYLDRLIQMSLDPTALAELHRQFGTAAMIRLSRSGELAPAAGDFAKQVLQAATDVARDPARLSRLAEQLGGSERRAAAQAAEQLLRAGADAVEPLVRAMSAAAADAPIQARAVELLRRLGQDAWEPLLALRQIDERPVRTATVRVIGQLDAPELATYLVGPLFAPVDPDDARVAQAAWQTLLRTPTLPQRREAILLLEREADRAFGGVTRGTLDADQRLERWMLDPRTQRLQRVALPTLDAAMLSAGRWYADLTQLEPERLDYRLRHLLCRLHVEQLAVGLDQPLPTGKSTAFELAQTMEPATIELALQQALDGGRNAAAIGAIRLLGQTQQLGWLVRREERSAPLVQALTEPHREVRFAAAEAIVRLNPPATFDGASRLADVLAYFATSRGQARVVVAHPQLGFGRDLAGLWMNHGYQSTVVSTGRELLRAAKESADVEMVLLSDALNDWTAWSIIEELRANPHTARLPIVILARRDQMSAAERWASDQPRTIAWTEDLAAADLETLIPQLTALAGPAATTAERRQEQGQAALGWLRQWISGSADVAAEAVRHEAWLIAALDAPALASDAAAVLAKLGSPLAQTALVDCASQPARPLATRQQAAQGFQESCAKFGVLLTRAQIIDQYARYNQSRNLDQATQVLLGGVLDAIELPHRPEPATP